MHRAVVGDEAGDGGVIPAAQALQVPDQGGVDLEELARQRLPLEQVGDLRLDALVAAGDRGDGGGGGDRDQQRVAQADGVDPAAQRLPPRRVRRLDPPEVELEGAGRHLGLVVAGMRAAGLGQVGGGGQGGEVDLLGDAPGQGSRLGVVEGQAQGEEHVLQAHHAESHRPPSLVGGAGRLGRVVVEVDHPVEGGHHRTDHRPEAVEVEAVGRDQPGQVDRPQVAHRGVGGVGDLEDLGAQVGQVDHVAGGAGLVGGAVGGVLERHPAVARLGQGAHHAGIELAGPYLADGSPVGLRRLVRLAERLTVEVAQLGHVARVEQTPHPVVLHPLHEQVGHPVGQVHRVHPPGLVAGVVPQFEEVGHVGMPRLQVHAARPLAPAALVDGGHRGVEGLEERHDAVGQPVGAPDERAAGADAGEADPDPAGVLGELGHVGVGGVDGLERVRRRVEQVARRQLRVGGAGVEQRRAGRQVVQRRHEPVEGGGLLHRRGQPAGHPEQEVLRRLDHLAALGMTEQVAVIDGA